MVSFTTTFVSAIAVFSVAQPIMAGGVIKGIFGKRSLSIRDPEAAVNAVWARDLTTDFKTCLAGAKETLKLTKEGTASFKLVPSEGKMPPACNNIAKSYQKTKQTDGQLTTNPDGTFTIHPNAKDVPHLAKLAGGK